MKKTMFFLIMITLGVVMNSQAQTCEIDPQDPVIITPGASVASYSWETGANQIETNQMIFDKNGMLTRVGFFHAQNGTATKVCVYSDSGDSLGVLLSESPEVITSGWSIGSDPTLFWVDLNTPVLATFGQKYWLGKKYTGSATRPLLVPSGTTGRRAEVFNTYADAFHPTINGEIHESGSYSFFGWIEDCVEPIFGCTDSGACNYDAAATNDDGSCEFLSCAGCTNPVACNYDNTATIDDGSCTFPDLYYDCLGECLNDTDNDGVCNELEVPGCTNPLACNFDEDATDDNGSCTLPVTEICGNGIDDDCDGDIDEDCAWEIPSSSPINVAGNFNLACQSLSGIVQSSLPQGDAAGWYSFVATSGGLRVTLLSSNNDLALELRDQEGNLIDFEDLVGGAGTEALNRANLVPGTTYYLGVIRVDDNGNSGTYEICAKRLRVSGCNFNTNDPVYAESRIKATWTLAQSYVFTFQSETTDIVYTHTLPGNTSVFFLGSLLGLVWNDTYVVSVQAVYTLPDGNGDMETIIVDPASPCTVEVVENLARYPYLRDMDACPNWKQTSSIVGTQRWIPGAAFYEWEFTPISPVGLPFTGIGGPVNRFIGLGTLPQIMAGTYDVRCRPIFGGGAPTSWGDVRCLQLLGPASAESESPSFSFEEGENNLMMDEDITVYPNPANVGNEIRMSLQGFSETVTIRVFDVTGKLVIENTVPNNQTIMLPNLEARGMYKILVTDQDGNSKTTTLVVV